MVCKIFMFNLKKVVGLQGRQKFQNGDSMTTSNVKPVNKCVLIVSDSTDELSDLQQLLVVDVGSCLKTDSELEGLRLFNENHPSVLIFAFQTVEKAEHFYLSLYQHNDQLRAVPHQTLLLCKSNESSKAYQLCKSGTFDDYVADRPLYDPFRLRLSVLQALNRRSQERYSYLLDDQIEKVTDRLHEVDQFISKELKVGGWTAPGGDSYISALHSKSCRWPETAGRKPDQKELRRKLAGDG